MKKIVMHDKRCEFRRNNVKFELFRENFIVSYMTPENRANCCRSGIKEILVHNVPEAEVKTFWYTMWNTREEKERDYSDYLNKFVPCSDTPRIFPSLFEFLNIIKFLKIGKLPVVMEHIQFFNKKMTWLH
ncbi:hypothetical protein NGRA_2569 [Nosema granulosis]|uniref:Uncharacterized protein n=1 Tax=Nosema granulosis TaxID=83296 RepID=A0A9P6GWV1_9MICR|nr:hypothetical protein NGRA_2569 [Nosema granulosis]